MADSPVETPRESADRDDAERADAVDEDARYRPIADYALIGDCHGTALVSRAGGIDWAALGRFDAEPVLCRLLDADRGGHWTIRPSARFETSRAYLSGTNILRTVFETATGRVALTDFMPVGRALDAGVHDYVHLKAPGWIVRRLEGLDGEVELAVDYRLSAGFATKSLRLSREGDRIEPSVPGPTLHGELPDLRLAGDRASARLSLAAGERRDLVLAMTRVEGESPCARIDEFLVATEAFWSEWLDYCRYDGPHGDMMRRSALTLKMLTYAPSGALVAAPTTSLPEEIGGERNWDYRYCWVRDASFALYALAMIGYSGEVSRFHEFVAHSAAASLPEVQPMYGIDGRMALEERELSHLEGYRGSAPVRVGNGAWSQRQIDNCGHLLDLALVHVTLGGELDRQYRRLLGAVARFVEARWEEPDESLWEMRGAPRQHVHAKLMCWVAADRAARLLDEPRWRPVAERIRRSIDEQGISAQGLKQAYDGGVDAAVLLAPVLGYPLERETLERTIDTVKSELARGDLLARYDGDDGLDGEEGAFLLCTSWLADAELVAGRREEARARIDRLVERANDVGLFSEEIDARSGAFLGNFPQAFTHLGLIGNLVHLALVEKHGEEALEGSHAKRASRAVSRSFGWQGVVAATVQSGRVGRIRSSDASKLAWP